MKQIPRAFWPFVLLGASWSGCASTPTPRPSAPPRVASTPSSTPTSTASGVSPSPPPRPGPLSPLEVTATAPPSNEIVVEGRSDLPPGNPSTAQPFARIADAAAERLRPALGECLRPLGAPARRSVRVVITTEGEFEPRPPQPLPLPHRVATCVEGVLRATTVEPAPPMNFPYDIFFDVE